MANLIPIGTCVADRERGPWLAFKGSRARAPMSQPQFGSMLVSDVRIGSVMYRMLRDSGL